MSKSKPRKKAVTQENQRLHPPDGTSPAPPVPSPLDDLVARWDDAAEELLTSRGWVSYRAQDTDQDGDGWHWMPSLLPTDPDDERAPRITTVFTDSVPGSKGFYAETAGAEGSALRDRVRHYDTLEELAADLEELEAWRVPADDYELPEDLTFSAGTPWAICERFARGALDEWGLVADLLHYPYEEDPEDPMSPRSFRQVRRAHRLELIPTRLYRVVVTYRAPQTVIEASSP